MIKYFITILCFLYFFDKIYSHSSQDYGKFKLNILKLKLCKGPKLVDCCKISTTLSNNTYMDYKIEIMKTTIPNRSPLARVHKFKYLGHWVTDNLVDDVDIERERKGLAVRRNMIAHRFAKCIAEGKITIVMNKQPLLRLQMKKPCDHLYMKGVFQALLNATQSCEFQKGKYHIGVDIQEVAKAYYGGEFLYGNMSFKSVFYNDECNFSCTELDVNFAPAK